MKKSIILLLALYTAAVIWAAWPIISTGTDYAGYHATEPWDFPLRNDNAQSRQGNGDY